MTSQSLRQHEDQPSRAPVAAVIRSLLATARPRQWIKNTLVFAAPATAGVLLEPAALAKTLVAFVAFCLASSATYFLNDAKDLVRDTAHPTKRLRPVAAASSPDARPGWLQSS